MPARSPAELHRQFAAAFAAHDVDAVVGLFDEDAVMVPGPNLPAERGLMAINRIVEGLLELRPSDVVLETVLGFAEQ